MTSARLVRAYTFGPSNCPRSLCRSSTLSFCVYMPPDDTLMIRAGALSSRSGISRLVSRNGPTTLVASVSSIPSAETPRASVITPALLTSTSRREA
jgi:hypothetical protein